MATKAEPSYQTLADMQGEHKRLMELLESEPTQAETGLPDETAERANLIRILDPLREFLRAGARCGAYLYEPRERRTAQAILDYWASKFYSARLDVQRPLLAPHDSALLPTLPDSACPYVGLEAFDEARASLFCGREERVEALVARLRRDRLVIVTGTSGCGKSSLMLAGLLPALRDGGIEGSAQWRYVRPLVPGDAPLENLADALAEQELGPDSARADGGTGRAALAQDLLDKPDILVRWLGADRTRPSLVVVDQFEEAMTLRTSENANAFSAFVAALQALVDTPAPSHRVVLTMRSDVDVQLAREYPELNRRYESAAFPLSSMDSTQLRRAIELPAARVGLKFQEGVVQQLIESVVGEDAGLPLLQFSLMALWDRRQGNLVTLDAQRKVGSPRMAMAQAAEEVYAQLPADQRVAAERIFLELSRQGEGAAVFRSRVTRGQLHEVAESEVADRVIEKFARARLVRVTQVDPSQPLSDKLEVAHEALLRNWGLLQTLFAQRRDERARRAFLRRQAQKWRESDFDSAFLLAGLALRQANEEFGQGVLNDLERGFLDASFRAEHQAQERANADSEARLQFERERALLAARKVKSRTIVVAILGMALVLSAVMLLGAGVRADARLSHAESEAKEKLRHAELAASESLRLAQSEADAKLEEAKKSAALEREQLEGVRLRAIERHIQAALARDKAVSERDRAARELERIRGDFIEARAKEVLPTIAATSDAAAFLFLASEAVRLNPAALPRLTSGLIEATQVSRADQRILPVSGRPTTALTLDSSGRHLLQAKRAPLDEGAPGGLAAGEQELSEWTLPAEGTPQLHQQVSLPSRSQVVFLDYAPDGNTIAAATRDAIWLARLRPSFEVPRRLESLTGAKKVHFSVDGRVLLAVADREVMAWSMAETPERVLLKWRANANIADAAMSDNGDSVFVIEFPNRQTGTTYVRQFRRSGDGFGDRPADEWNTLQCSGPRTTIAAGGERIGLSMSPRLCLVPLPNSKKTAPSELAEPAGTDRRTELADIIIRGEGGRYLIKLVRMTNEAQIVDLKNRKTVRLQRAFDLPQASSYEPALSMSHGGTRLAVKTADNSIRIFNLNWAARSLGDREVTWLSSNDEVMVVRVPTATGQALEAVDAVSGTSFRSLSEDSLYRNLQPSYFDGQRLYATARCSEQECVVTQDLRSRETRPQLHRYGELVRRSEGLYVLRDGSQWSVYSAPADAVVFNESPPESGSAAQALRFVELGNGSTFAVRRASDGVTSVEIYAVEGKQARRLTSFPLEQGEDYRFLGNGRALLLTRARGGTLVDLQGGADMARIEVPRGAALVVGALTGIVAMRAPGKDWSLQYPGERGQPSGTLPGNFIIEANGWYAYSIDKNGWHVRRLSKPNDPWLDGPAASVGTRVEFSRNSEAVAVHVGDKVSVFDLKTRQARLEIDAQRFASPSLSPGGRYVQFADGRLIPADARRLLDLARSLHRVDDGALRCQLLGRGCARVPAVRPPSGATR